MDPGKLQDLLCKGISSGKYMLFFSALNTFLTIATILGNALILLALRKKCSLHPPSKFLYSCLTVTDLLVGVVLGPSIVVYHLTLMINSSQRLDLCVFSANIGVVSFTVLTSVSLLTLTATSVDRLLALLLGLSYRHIVTLRRVQALVVCAWIPSITFALMMFWDYVIAKIYGYALQSLCLLISAFCYSKIFLSLRRHKTEIQAHVHQRKPNGSVPVNIERYRKTVCTAIWILVTVVVCYLPYILVTAVFSINGPFPSLTTACWVTGTLVFLNSSLNPLLFCWRNREVRQAVKMTIRQMLCWSY